MVVSRGSKGRSQAAGPDPRKERPHPETLALSGPESKSQRGSFRQCKCFPRKFPFLLPDQEEGREQIEFS